MKMNRKFALMAGIALLIMSAIAAFSFGYAHNTLVIPGNPEVTANNLKSSSLLFGLEILGWHIILLCDIIVAWALFNFFKNDNRNLSLATAGIRVIYTIILGVAIFNLIYVLKIVNGNVEITPEMTNHQIITFIESFESTWSFGLIIFGFHLLLLGVLVLKSDYIQNLWGILLVFAAVSYIVIHFARLFLPEFESQITTVEIVLSLPMAFGEIGFAFWLIIQGGKPKTMYKSVNELKLQS